jgi:hypothetical protein
MRSTLRLFTLLGVAALSAGAAIAADDEIEVGVGLELNYTYNFNRPASGKNTFLFNSREGQFLLNLGEVHVSRQASVSDKRVGFRLSVVDGEVARILLRDPSYNASNPNVLEAYGSAYVKDNMLIQFGQFLSNVGVDTVKVGDGQFFSRSFQYQFLQPIYGAGIRTTKIVNDSESWTGSITNRFRGVEEATGNRDLFYGLQYAKTLSEKASVKVNLLTGRESLGNVNRELGLANVVYDRAVGEDTRVGTDLTWRSGKEASNRRYSISGIGGYMTHKLSENRTLGLRGEFLSQSNATAGILPIGTNSIRKPTLGSITASLELKNGALPGVRTLIEWRIDNASDPVFASKNGVKKNQNTLTLGQTYRF